MMTKVDIIELDLEKILNRTIDKKYTQKYETLYATKK